MHDQPIPVESGDDALARAILDLLTIDHAGHWSMAELDRTLSPSSGASPSRTEDAVESLYAAGLVHRHGDFVFATRAAHEVQRLAS